MTSTSDPVVKEGKSSFFPFYQCIYDVIFKTLSERLRGEFIVGEYQQASDSCLNELENATTYEWV